MVHPKNLNFLTVCSLWVLCGGHRVLCVPVCTVRVFILLVCACFLLLYVCFAFLCVCVVVKMCFVCALCVCACLPACVPACVLACLYVCLQHNPSFLLVILNSNFIIIFCFVVNATVIYRLLVALFAVVILI